MCSYVDRQRTAAREWDRTQTETYTRLYLHVQLRQSPSCAGAVCFNVCATRLLHVSVFVVCPCVAIMSTFVECCIEFCFYATSIVRCGVGGSSCAAM